MEPADKLIDDPNEQAQVWLDKFLLRIRENPSYLAYLRGASVQANGREVHVVFMRLPDDAVEPLKHIAGCDHDALEFFQFSDANRQELLGMKVYPKAWENERTEPV